MADVTDERRKLEIELAKMHQIADKQRAEHVNDLNKIHAAEFLRHEEEQMIEDLKHELEAIEPLQRRAEEAEARLQEVIEDNVARGKEIRRFNTPPHHSYCRACLVKLVHVWVANKQDRQQTLPCEGHIVSCRSEASRRTQTLRGFMSAAEGDGRWSKTKTHCMKSKGAFLEPLESLPSRCATAVVPGPDCSNHGSPVPA